MKIIPNVNLWPPHTHIGHTQKLAIKKKKKKNSLPSSHSNLFTTISVSNIKLKRGKNPSY